MKGSQDRWKALIVRWRTHHDVLFQFSFHGAQGQILRILLAELVRGDGGGLSGRRCRHSPLRVQGCCGGSGGSHGFDALGLQQVSLMLL